MEMTRFERARLIGARALQIAMGAKPLVKLNSQNPVEIAKKELEKGIIPLKVERELKEE